MPLGGELSTPYGPALALAPLPPYAQTMDTFTGIPEAALGFYAALESNNNAQWWLENKDKYDADVLAPLLALSRSLEPRFGPGRIFRPHQDMRFSRTKEPYKTAQGMFLSHFEDVGYYLHLSSSGLTLAGGYTSASAAQLSRYRAAVDASASGTSLVGIVEQLVAAGFTIGGQKLKTVPRGFPKDHPRPGLLQHKSLNATLDLGQPEWLENNGAAERITEYLEQLRPLIDWVVRHAAP
ncbi:uncharacterized protein (TIGR02453 family) [Arthrobacter sp. UYCu511]